MENIFGVGSGVRFHPSDEESIEYLFNKKLGTPLLHDGLVIKESDLYEDKEPREIIFSHGAARSLGEGVDDERNVGFYYSKLKKKTPKAQRYCRTVGKRGGTWSGVNKGQPICDLKGQHIGFKKSFVYEKKGSSKQQKHDGGHWLMNEYSLGGYLLEEIKKKRNQCEEDDMVVLCRIKKKDIEENKNTQLIDLESSAASSSSSSSSSSVVVIREPTILNGNNNNQLSNGYQQEEEIDVSDFEIVEMEFVSSSSASTQASITYATAAATAMGEEILGGEDIKDQSGADRISNSLGECGATAECNYFPDWFAQQ